VHFSTVPHVLKHTTDDENLKGFSKQVVQTIGLQPVGKRQMASATHSIPVNVYLVDLLLPFGNARYIVSGTQVMEFTQVGGEPSNPYG
jgi:hypothetical protein